MHEAAAALISLSLKPDSLSIQAGKLTAVKTPRAVRVDEVLSLETMSHLDTRDRLTTPSRAAPLPKYGTPGFDMAARSKAATEKHRIATT